MACAWVANKNVLTVKCIIFGGFIFYFLARFKHGHLTGKI